MANDNEQNQAMNAKELNKTLAVKVYKSEESAEKKVTGLSCYVFGEEDWHKTDVPVNISVVPLSTYVAREARSKSDQPVPVKLTKFNNFWMAHLQEDKHAGEVEFDGLRRHQSILTECSTSTIFTEEQKIILTSRKESDDQDDNAKDGLPEVGEFGLEFSGQQKRYFIYRNVLIGMNPCADIKAGFKPFNSLITMYGDKLYFVDMGFEDILVNGAPTESLCVGLNEGDVLTINKVEITVHLPAVHLDPLAGKVAESGLCLLDVLSTGETLDRIYLPKGKSLTFGRGAACDVVIDKKTLSRKHAQLIVYDDHVLVLDCYSSNGTFVNDEEVGRGRARAGDTVTFGDVKYLVCYYNG